MNDYISNLKNKLEQIEKNYQDELKKIRALGAHPSLLESIYVDYYGSKIKLNQIASIKIQDGTILIINPFDKSQRKGILFALEKANLGFNIQDDGFLIKIFVPPLTEEKRKLYVKKAKEVKEQAKINLRNIRQEINKKINSDKELSKDQINNYLKNVQDQIDYKNKVFEDILKEKEKSLLMI
ncbi:ribosome-recycling factor [Candidatus Hepatoplasma crinochetorum]|jgi:ribosome recycling factor|uniref:Ribosome-releasing factor n=1 Tax=Candidatus Hepatoplasma crinochetorum Av TaxID=1427984 RepID=W8GER6_9MOLU|nr:ribosome-recycling factor [Candidatus Hepatoplasma crinochetorum]AHK22284.1 Ribosome-releasing factor [Candidatus Hepatoplasma crinochetorum Av]BDV02870.1 MAG: ribosome-recycling factor [Candidatus Hepatoplasma crinochetorum]